MSLRGFPLYTSWFDLPCGSVSKHANGVINVVGRNPRIILVTGIMASGKSTVAQLLAEQFERSVHLRGDLFRKMIVNGRREMQPDGEEEAEVE